MADISGIDRRKFLELTGLSTAGLVVGFRSVNAHPFVPDAGVATTLEPNVFVRVESDGGVYLTVHRSEMGQGVRTSCAMILAEELDVDWDSVSVEQADAHPRYGSQATGGSESIRTSYHRLRQAGAAAREVLVLAAASSWGVPAAECTTGSGTVRHAGSGREAGYGDLVDAAASLPVPSNPTLKSPDDFTLIGTEQKMYDVEALGDGSATFTGDLRLPGLKYATIERSPQTRATLRSYDASGAMAVPGVVSVLEVDGSSSELINDGVAVVAENSWAALQGRAALEIEWTPPAGDGESTAPYREMLHAAVNSEGRTVREEGSIGSAAGNVIRAEYRTPYLAHASMEPPVCTAWVRDGSCEIWAPTQSPQWSRTEIAGMLGIPADDVTLHVTLLGGGFGRKGKPDFVLEAVAVARQVDGPVQLFWTREDDVRHCIYHPESCQLVTAVLDDDGYPQSWHHRTAFPAIGWSFQPGGTEPTEGELGLGFTNMPYRIPNVRLEACRVPSDLRIGWLRSVCNIYHAFAVGSFVDELAHAAGIDPVTYQRMLLGEPRILEVSEADRQSPYKFDTGRLWGVLGTAAERARWKRDVPEGHGWGIAAHYSFNSFAATAVLVDVSDGTVKVREVYTAVDVGTVVNPDGIRAQMEGAVMFGLSGALYGEITVADGVVQQGNFNDYPMLRINQAPDVDVHIVASDAAPTGIGEPGVPPLAPALCNAVFDATGTRIRELPLALHGLV